MTVLPKLRENLVLFGAKGLAKWSVNYLRWYLQRRRGLRFREMPVHDFRLVIDLHDIGIAKELMINGTREEEHLYLLERYLRPGMTVLDCGANIGYYSILMGRRVRPTGKVYAVEPDRANFNLLNLKIRLNGLEHTVESFNLGFSDRVGVEKFYRSVMSNRHTFHPQEYQWTGAQVLVDAPPAEVQVTTIAAFATGRRPIDLVRMDIEGYEVEVFRGMKDAVAKRAAPSILFEVHPSRYDPQAHDMEGPLRDLMAAGYRARWLASDGHRRGGGREAFETLGYGPDRIEREFGRCDRAIYRDVWAEHAVELICRTPWVRAAVLERPK